MHEQSPQPEPDFDTWLTTLPDEELLRLTKAAEQPFVGPTDDPLGLAEAMDIAMHYRGEPYQSEEDATSGLIFFGMQMAIERMRRNGDVTKEGTYSLEPEANSARLTLTEQGSVNLGPSPPDSEQ